MKDARIEDDILRSLRRIMRANDIHSRRLATVYGLTAPQLVCLRAVGQLGAVAPGRLARDVSLSQGTVTGIIDRLASRQLVTRERTSKDRRVVTVTITPAGRALIDQAPSPLQESFTAKLRLLPRAERERLRDTLETIVRMMGGEDIDAAPILAGEPLGPAAETPGGRKRARSRRP